MENKTEFIKKRPDFVGNLRIAGWIQPNGTIRIKMPNSFSLFISEVTKK